MVNPGGTGMPILHISARLAPLPPSSSFICLAVRGFGAEGINMLGHFGFTFWRRFRLTIEGSIRRRGVSGQGCRAVLSDERRLLSLARQTKYLQTITHSRGERIVRIRFETTIDDVIAFQCYHSANSPAWRRQVWTQSLLGPAIGLAMLLLLRVWSTPPLTPTTLRKRFFVSAGSTWLPACSSSPPQFSGSSSSVGT